MKKLIAILFALALVAMLPLTAMAATGINANEQAVLDKLAEAIDLGAKGDYVIPKSYINTAKNYFAGDCNMTEAEAEAIIDLLSQGAAIVKEESSKVSGSSFDLKKLSADARAEILAIGQDACEVVDLELAYDSQAGEVVITEAGSNTPVFENSAVIKSTGSLVTVNATFVCVAVVLCLALSTGVMFVVSKKNGLLEK